MKIKNTYAAILFLVVSISGCVDEDILSPIVQTGEVSDISTSSAMLSGELVVQGTETIIELGFRYSSDSSLVVSGDGILILTDRENINEVGPFFSEIENLTSQTTYFYMAIAKTEELTAVGEIKSLTTQ